VLKIQKMGLNESKVGLKHSKQSSSLVSSLEMSGVTSGTPQVDDRRCIQYQQEKKLNKLTVDERQGNRQEAYNQTKMYSTVCHIYDLLMIITIIAYNNYSNGLLIN